MINLAGIAQQQYIGAPFGRPIDMCKPRTMGASAISLAFVWQTYQAVASDPDNVSVKVTAQVRGPKAPLDKIVSVYIDNLGSGVPVYVIFPDTTFTVVCQPQAAGWYPVFTNEFDCYVVARGLKDSDPSQTSVYLTNLFIPPYTDLEFPQSANLHLASAEISRGTTIYNRNYGTPAVGDQVTAINRKLDTNDDIDLLWNTPVENGFIYLTHLYVVVMSVNSVPLDSPGHVIIESTGSAGILFKSEFSNASGLASYNLINLQGTNIKLDATQQWRVRSQASVSGGATARMSFQSVYTHNPN